MSGIVFLKTKNLNMIRDFYLSIGMKVWLKQAECTILKHGNMLLGFCERDEIDKQGIITFFYDEQTQVDSLYEKYKTISTSSPKINEKYNIYNFFAQDPEGRTIEFQTFLSPIISYQIIDEALIKRRSIRKFKKNDISNDLLNRIFDVCRFSPTSRNCQSFYYIVIRNPEVLSLLASLRESSSAPIAKAPCAVAVCIDTDKTKRIEQDGAIAAYHFILAAYNHGLGTCWIGAMDRDEAKTVLNIPAHHFIATITPLGYPDETKTIPERRNLGEFVRFF
ncbi:MAG: nitroreductase family protein [Candidatus Coatesbacteria bacterium]|nr:nitroreductase family protein [Candidatus Coatesbacteria bacterium]